MKRALIIIILLSTVSYAHTVTFNFALNMSTDKSEVIRVNRTLYNGNAINTTYFPATEKRFISAQNSAVIFALFHSGEKFLGINLDTNYSSGQYLFSLISNDKDTATISFTQGNWQDFERLESAPVASGKNAKTSVILQYLDIDILGRIRWNEGAREIFIKNIGVGERGIPRILIQLIK